jgi:excisionase family DNA binding protein
MTMPKRTPAGMGTLEQELHAAGITAEEIQTGARRLLAENRGHQLAETRKQLGLAQKDIAATLGVSIARISQIEHGEVTSFEVIARTRTGPAPRQRRVGRPRREPMRGPADTARVAAASRAASATDVGNSPADQAAAADARHRRRRRRGSDMAVPPAAETAGQGTSPIARLLASDMRDDLLAIMREIFAGNAFAGRLAYSPDEAADLLGISRELVHDLLRTGQLGSVKAGRRRLIARHHLEAFLTGKP